MNAFEVLEIAPTTDKREIKKAYARLTKKYHPEEHPQEWKRIHDAYIIALQQTQEHSERPPKETQEHSERPPKESQDTKRKAFRPEEDILEKHLEQMERQRQLGERKKVPSKRREKETVTIEDQNDAVYRKPDTDREIDETFNHLEEMAERVKEEERGERQQQLKKAMAELSNLCAMKTPCMELWRKFFQKEEYQWAIRQGEFLYYLADKLEECNGNRELFSFLKEQIEMIQRYNISINEIPKKRGLIDPYQLIFRKLKNTDGYYHQGKAGGRWGAVAAIFLLLLLAFAALWGKRENKTDLTVKNSVSVLNTSSDTTLSVLEMLGKDNQKATLQRAKKLGEGIYVIGDIWEVTNTISEDSAYTLEKVIPEQQIYLEGEPVDIPSESYAFVIYANQKKSIVLWCDLQLLVGQTNADIYYYNGTEYQKYYQKKAQKEETTDWDRRYLHEMQGGWLLYIETSMKSDKEQYPIIVIPMEN